MEPRADRCRGECTVTNDSRSSILRGTPGDDLICAGGGKDVMRGGAGDDRLAGGAGNDDLFGEAGRDPDVCAPTREYELARC